MAAAALLALPFCRDCAGGGDVNGVPCGCGGSGRKGAVRRRRRLSLSSVAGPLADVAGWSVGRVLSLLPTVPGVAGAAMVSLGLGELAGHVFGHGLAPWVAITAGGAFALWLGSEVNRVPAVPPAGEH